MFKWFFLKNNTELCNQKKKKSVRSVDHYNLKQNIMEVSDQNGISPLYIMLEIHHCGREPLLNRSRNLVVLRSVLV